MKKVVFLSLMLTVLFTPQFVLAGGGPAVETSSLAPDQIPNTNIENPAAGDLSSTESVSENQASANNNEKSSLFAFFPAASEHTTISSVISVIVLLGSLALVAGVTFFTYKYYRKTQEINRMLGIDIGESDLDETTKTE